jgi:hypothetical protein
MGALTFYETTALIADIEYEPPSRDEEESAVRRPQIAHDARAMRSAVLVARLQQVLGCAPDGIYGPDTRELHLRVGELVRLGPMLRMHIVWVLREHRNLK